MTEKENLFEFDFRKSISKSFKKWNKQGFTLEQAKDWDRNGFTLEGAIEFSNKDISPTQAKKYIIELLKKGYLDNMKIVLPTGTYTNKMLREFVKKEFESNLL